MEFCYQSEIQRVKFVKKKCSLVEICRPIEHQRSELVRRKNHSLQLDEIKSRADIVRAIS